MLATAAGQPDFDDPQDEINAFYDDNGALLGLSTRLFIVPSVFFLLAFLEGLRSLPRRSDGETAPLSALVLGGGIATAVLILASRVPTEVAIHEGEKGRLTSELARSLDDLGYTLLAYSSITLAIVLGATAALAMGESALRAGSAGRPQFFPPSEW